MLGGLVMPAVVTVELRFHGDLLGVLGLALFVQGINRGLDTGQALFDTLDPFADFIEAFIKVCVQFVPLGVVIHICIQYAPSRREGQHAMTCDHKKE